MSLRPTGRRQRRWLFGLSEPAQAGSEPQASAPCRGQRQWPGKAGSTAFPEWVRWLSLLGTEMTVRWPAEAIWEAVVSQIPDFTVEVLPQVDSTNSELMRRARAGRIEPVLLVAETQTAGRGRLGRQWFSGNEGVSSAGPSQAARAPSGLEPAAPNLLEQVRTGDRGEASGDPRPARPRAVREATSVGAISALTFSLGLPLQMADWSGLSLAVGVSVVQSLHPDLQLKWPNDVWLQDRKLAGILIESTSVGAARYAVIGVGINLAPRPASGLATAPAWLQELLPGIDAPQTLQRLAAPLARAVKLFEAQGFAPFSQAFMVRDALAGRSVGLSDGTTGQARGVDAHGALLVHTSAGLKKISSSEVSVRPTN